jgi:mRNA-degrading endonuclease RelE of RelBE toxin-antitoxin system
VSSPYHIKIAPAAHRQFLALPVKTRKNIFKLVEGLRINPRPPTAKKIDGMTGLYCDLVDHVRLIYKIDDQEILLLLVK